MLLNVGTPAVNDTSKYTPSVTANPIFVPVHNTLLIGSAYRVAATSVNPN